MDKINKNTVTTIFFHHSNPEYLNLVIQQATQKNQVILIGDNSNSHLSKAYNLTHLNANAFTEHINKFKLIYKHLSSNGKLIEYLCFIRWIIIYNVCKKLDLKTIFYSDSDNLIMLFNFLC